MTWKNILNIFDLNKNLNFQFFFFVPGVYSETDTPVSIPNTEVKRLCGDDTVYKNTGK